MPQIRILTCPNFVNVNCDCEQAEYAILKSTPAEVLGKFRYIIIEFHPEPAGESVIEAQTKLKAAGFQLAHTLPNAHCPGFTSVFVRG